MRSKTNQTHQKSKQNKTTQKNTDQNNPQQNKTMQTKKNIQHVQCNAKQNKTNLSK